MNLQKSLPYRLPLSHRDLNPNLPPNFLLRVLLIFKNLDILLFDHLLLMLYVRVGHEMRQQVVLHVLLPGLHQSMLVPGYLKIMLHQVQTVFIIVFEIILVV